MTARTKYQSQIVISGVGGQGVLFVTRLLAEAAIREGLPVYTSETHGMAQRGGTVISHLKVGSFSSPLIRPRQADGLIALKAEGIGQHGGYLRPRGWTVVNSNTALPPLKDGSQSAIDADQLALDLESPKSLNLIILGFALSPWVANQVGGPPLFCSHEDILEVLKVRLKDRDALLENATRALLAGVGFTP